jgi:hypothetical protein
VTADQRVTSAREYLDSARRRKVTQLPPSLLMRECAELRRLLSQALDVIAEDASALEEARAALLSSYAQPAVTLGQDQAAIALEALEVAAEYRRFRASVTCQACADHPAELCDDHQADLDEADEYDALAARIGGAR